jgi:glycosyltransferase involved in cell wall biosynthesis
MKNLKISVIMPSFNQVDYIEEAITSFLAQKYDNKELIVIDGGSTDGSVDIIQKYAHSLAYWVSEPDTGQSNAINKGFQKATGQLLTWLNSDDVLLPGALNLAAKKAAAISDPRQRWITGGCFWLNPDGSVISCSHARSWNQITARLGLVSVYSPSSFFSREVLDEFGNLDESLHYSMDTEFWLRLAKSGIRYTASGDYCWGLRLHPNAKMSGHLFLNEDDRKLNPVFAKHNSEADKISTRYAISSHGLKIATLLHKFFSATSPTFWQSQIKNLQYRGKYWQQCFEPFSRSSWN